MGLKRSWRNKLLAKLNKILPKLYKNTAKYERYCKYFHCDECVFQCREPILDEDVLEKFEEFSKNSNSYSDFDFLCKLKNIFRKERENAEK